MLVGDTGDELRAKIKALFAKSAATSNEHEATAFASKAHELMQKYQITVDALGIDGDEVGEDTLYTSPLKGINWHCRVALATAKYFHCKPIFETTDNGTSVRFVGRESARVTAFEMFSYFISAINVSARHMQQSAKLNRFDCGKQIGLAFANRLLFLVSERQSSFSYDQLSVSIAANRNALVKIDQVDSLFEMLFPKDTITTVEFDDGPLRVEANERALAISIDRQVYGNQHSLLPSAKG